MHDLIVAFSEFIKCSVVDNFLELALSLRVKQDWVNNIITHGGCRIILGDFFFAIELDGRKVSLNDLLS